MTPPIPTTLSDWQGWIEHLYGEKDRRRGAEATFLWFAEEVGELAAGLREAEKEALAAEFADVLAWLATLANVCDIDLQQAMNAKYGAGCPGCRVSPCQCGDTKP